MNVVEPGSAGIGGDVFVIAWLAKEKKLVALNGSGKAPSGATPRHLAERGAVKEMPQHGIDSATVPGAVDAWDVLLKRAGSRTFKELLQPAVDLAEQGYAVSERIRNDWIYGAEVLQADADSVKTFLVVAVNQAEKSSRFAGPRQGREFVNGGDEEGGQAAVDRFVNSEDRQEPVAGEGAFRVVADNPQVGRCVDTGNEAEGVAVKLVAAPGTVFNRDRRGIAVGILLKVHRLGVGGVLRRGAGIAAPAHAVGCGGGADPQSDFERPFAKLGLVLLALQASTIPWQLSRERRAVGSIVVQQGRNLGACCRVWGRLIERIPASTFAPQWFFCSKRILAEGYS